MKLKLNLLTGKVNTEADITTAISKEEFWQYYLKSINIVKPILTDREIDFVAAFCVHNDAKFLQEHLKMSAPNYYGMVKRLITKGILKQSETELSLHKNIEKLLNYVNQQNDDVEVTITFPLIIK